MNRNELKECLAEDRKRILGNTQAYHVFFIVATRHSAWLRWKYVKNMRNAAFYQERFQAGNKLSGFPMMWYLRRKNLIGNKLGFEIGGVQPQSEKDSPYTTTGLWLFTENQKSERIAHCMVTIASVTMA